MLVKEVSIHSPAGVSTYILNQDLFKIDEKGSQVKLDYKPVEIKVGFFNTVKVRMSNGMILVYKKFPIVYEK